MTVFSVSLAWGGPAVFVQVFFLLFRFFGETPGGTLFGGIRELSLFCGVFHVTQVVKGRRYGTFVRGRHIFRLGYFCRLGVYVTSSCVLFRTLLSLVLRGRGVSVVPFFRLSTGVRRCGHPLGPGCVIRFHGTFLQVVRHVIACPLRLFRFFWCLFLLLSVFRRSDTCLHAVVAAKRIITRRYLRF